MAQVKWDSPTWEEKTRARTDGTACRVKASLQCLSHVDCNTLDRFAESAACFMQRSRSTGYASGFACVVFDHDEAYCRVKRLHRFRCLVPIISPGAAVVVDGELHRVPAGRMVYFEPWRLLFGEAGAVPGTVARLLNMSCYDIATLGRGSRLIRFEANHLAYTRPIRFVHPFPTAKGRVNRS